MTMYDNYAGLIFDMDGTLLDSEPTHDYAWQQVLNRYGVTLDAQEMAAFNGSPNWRIAQIIIARYQLDLDPYQLAQDKTSVFESLPLDSITPLPLIEVVKAYHGRKPMAVGTGTEHRVADRLLRHIGLRDYISVLVGADDVEHHKPAPDTFLRCAELLGVPAEQCIVFEDAEFGIQAARHANMAVVDVRTLWSTSS